MATSWAHPVAVAVWMALHGLARPATTREIAHSLGWLPPTVEQILARLRHARFVQWDAGARGWVVGNDLRRSLQAYGVRLWGERA